MKKNGLIELETEPALGEEVILGADKAATLEQWNPRVGSAFTAASPSGVFFRARLIEWDGSSARLLVFERLPREPESPLQIVLIQALPDKERMELIIEKSVELGVDVIVPWRARKGISLEERESRQPKAHKWPDLARRAAKQCRRGKIPWIAPYSELAAALDLSGEGDLKICLFEEATVTLKDFLAQERSGFHEGPRGVSILVGPEGGLTREEVDLAVSKGFAPVSLGPRILRTETAAIAAAALMQFALGDLGGAGKL